MTLRLDKTKIYSLIRNDNPFSLDAFSQIFSNKKPAKLAGFCIDVYILLVNQ